MTGKYPVTDETIGKVSNKLWELLRRLKQRTLDAEFVLRELQRIIEGIPEISPEEIRNRADKCSKRHPNGGGRVMYGAYADPNAYIGPDAIVGGDVMMRSGENVRIEGKSIVYGNITIEKNFTIKDSAVLFGHVWVLGPVEISGDVWVIGKSGVMLSDGLVIHGGGSIVLKGHYKGGRMIVR